MFSQLNGRKCECGSTPVCRYNYRDKQAPGWHLEHAGARGWFRWTTPSGRSYLMPAHPIPRLSRTGSRDERGHAARRAHRR